VTPHDLAGVSRADTLNSNAVAIAQLLQSLDDASNSSNITIPTSAATALYGVAATSVVSNNTALSQSQLSSLVSTATGNVKTLKTVAISGSNMTAYIRTAYPNLDRKLGVVNSTICAVSKDNMAYPDSYKGSFGVPTPVQTFQASVIRSIGFKDYYAGNSKKPTGCTDTILYAHNLYIELLDRVRQAGADKVWVYDYGPWDDFGKPVFSVAKTDYQISESELQFIVDEAAKRDLKVYLSWQFSATDKKGNSLALGATPTQATLKQMLDSYRALIVDRASYASQIGIAGMTADWDSFYINSSDAYKEFYLTEMLSIIDDIRKVFSGKLVYGAASQMIDSRFVGKIDSRMIGLGIFPALTDAENKNLTVSALKERYLANILQSYKAMPLDIPVEWNVMAQSKYDFYIKGWTEDGFCVNGCIQKSYVTDFSVQAVGIEAAFEALSSQTSFVNSAINLSTGYWMTDDMTPVDSGNNTDFPNLSQSIRNKPAESIVQHWFGR